jgi:hypothetical protein
MRFTSFASSSIRPSLSVCVTLLLAAAAAGPASAQAVLVDFEQLTSAPCTFAQTTPLHDELASLGIHFAGPTTIDGGAVLDQCGNFIIPPHSGFKFLTFNSALSAFPGGGSPVGPETVSFDQRVTNVDIWVASGLTTTATFVIDAFDGATHVGSNTLSVGPVWTLFSISVAGGLTRVVLDANVSIYIYDDLSFTPQAGPPPTAYCFGDGSGTACPCGNAGAAGNGCASSVNGAGGHLSASGAASIANDTLSLNGSGMANSSALYFQGTTQLGGGAGLVFGDGLRCVGGSIIRLGTKVNVAGASSYPSGSTPISVKGANAAGSTRTYQVWYRNAAPFCNPETFNLTNGLQLTWAP